MVWKYVPPVRSQAGVVCELLIVNAFEEGNGSKQVWQFWQCVSNQDFAKRIRDHSIDESRHSKMFATLVNILFPMSLDEAEDTVEIRLS